MYWNTLLTYNFFNVIWNQLPTTICSSRLQVIVQVIYPQNRSISCFQKLV